MFGIFLFSESVCLKWTCQCTFGNFGIDCHINCQSQCFISRLLSPLPLKPWNWMFFSVTFHCYNVVLLGGHRKLQFKKQLRGLLVFHWMDGAARGYQRLCCKVLGRYFTSGCWKIFYRNTKCNVLFWHFATHAASYTRHFWLCEHLFLWVCAPVIYIACFCFS